MIFWLYLVIAILTEVVGTTMMKVSQGLTRLVPAVLMFVMYAISFIFMALALKARGEHSLRHLVWAGHRPDRCDRDSLVPGVVQHPQIGGDGIDHWRGGAA